jgi:hypothetical protein
MLRAHERTASAVLITFCFSTEAGTWGLVTSISPEPDAVYFPRSVSHNECAWVWFPRRPVECFLHRIHSTIRIHIKPTHVVGLIIVIACDRFSIRRKCATIGRCFPSKADNPSLSKYTNKAKKISKTCIYALIVCALVRCCRWQPILCHTNITCKEYNEYAIECTIIDGGAKPTGWALQETYSRLCFSGRRADGRVKYCSHGRIGRA